MPAVEAAIMPKYYSLMLSPNISKAPEGYLICRNVPICRSGYQEYLGAELEGFPGYSDSWGLDPDEKYRVFRPKDEVLHPDTVASFEGKTVVDEHPDGAVHIDNDGVLNCGHAQYVREGDPLPNGEVTLAADLIIKDPDLVEKVYPEGDPDRGVRQVSCGYSLKLKRLADGTIVMTEIRGNHVAVVEKGRAGSLIAIQDSAPPEIIKEKKTMSLRELIFGRGLKALAQDASPDELAAIEKELSGAGTVKTTVAADAAPKVAADAESKDPHHMAAHDCLDRILEARAAKDRMGKDAFGEPAHVDALKKELEKYVGEEKEEATPAGDSELEELKEEKKEEEKAGDATPEEGEENEEAAADEDLVDEIKGEEKGESVLNAAKTANDSVREHLRATKPLVASIIAKPKAKRTQQEQVMVDSYNKAVKSLNGAGTDAYKAFAKVQIPERLAADAAAAIQKQEDVTRFYEGVPYQVGKAKHEAYLASKEGK